jgi:polyhydroxybutyrate depolymerase
MLESTTDLKRFFPTFPLCRLAFSLKGAGNLETSMKKYLPLFALLFSSWAFAQTGTTITDSIFTGGEYRIYRVYIPNIYSSSNAAPLVFNFHGYGSNNVQQEYYGDFRPISDTANFILVHPQGTIVNGNTGWNNFGPVSQASDDINFISDLIDSLSAQYNIDQNKVYSTGMSNGGFMSYDLACFLSHRITAVASVTGSMITLHKNACSPVHPTPVMQIHGTADQVVSYNGSGGIVASMHIDSLVKHWVQFNNCNPAPSITQVPDINTADGCTAERHVYAGGSSGTKVELYKIINGGHTWPGSFPSFNGNTNQDFKASSEIWRFFRQYDRSQLTGVKEQEEAHAVSVYPNPSSGTFVLEAGGIPEARLEIFNTLGEIVHRQKISGPATSVSLDRSPGAYFYRVMGSNGTMRTGMLIIYRY